MEKSQKKIGVIGSGIAGITAAYLLQKKHEVTLIEQNSYVGGHTNTAAVPDGPDAGTAVDTGFIVFNQRTYPTLITFFNRLDVPCEESDMSFSYYDRAKNIIYNTNGLGGIFFRKRNILNIGYWRLLKGLFRYGKIFEEALLSGTLKNKTLGDFFATTGLPDEIIEWLIIPMASAIWSASFDDMMDFPAETFARFYYNHGLLTLFKQPQWYYVKGGSSSYVKKFLDGFSGTLHLNRKVVSVKRGKHGCTVKAEDGSKEKYDHVIIASHADQALAMLDAPTEEEKRLLGPWSYSSNRVVLHTDISHLPPERGVWASWNYVPDTHTGNRVNVTYWMNNLQNLATSREYCVSLNAGRPIESRSIIGEYRYEHPIFNFQSINTQGELSSLNGKSPLSFCGSYFGYGFHEDACLSAIKAVEPFGVTL